MLAIYLVVLVPLNWLLFRVIGKVEWAWIAAPVIAILGAFAVVRYASLDIGFVRSVTNVGVLELQGDYSRGHLTDYAALYTSLSTRYEVELDNATGQSLPFAKTSSARFKPGESLRKVQLNRSATTELDNFLVKSNSTGLLHTEMMLDVGGALRLVDSGDQWKIDNQTTINLLDAGAIRKNEAGGFEFAWIGELDAGSESEALTFSNFDGEVKEAWGQAKSLVGSAQAASLVWEEQGFEKGKPVSLEDLQNVPSLVPDWKELSELLRIKMRVQDSDSINKGMLAGALAELESEQQNVSLTSIFQVVAENLKLGDGEVRLIGRSTQKLDQTKYSPAATQKKQDLLVVVHLKHAKLPPCRRDQNAISDFERARSNIDQEEDESFIDTSLGEKPPR
jgi:hypothetical protein